MSYWLGPRTLSRLAPGVAAPAYAREQLAHGVLHFGPGAFHRVHQAWYLHRLLARDPRWGICEVSLHSTAVRDALEPQDGLYTLAIRDRASWCEIVGSILEVLVAPEAPERVYARLVAPEARVWTLTVTEKGYCLAPDGSLDTVHPDIEHDLQAPAVPRSAPGWIVAGLERRRAQRLTPPLVLSCDNLVDNGTKLRNAVLVLARARDRALADWIEAEVMFPRTMVDSITPATTDELRERVARMTGLRDRWPVQREEWVQWVIETHPPCEEPDWAAAGATLSDDVSAYERAKLRLLNGAHSTLAYLGLLAGHRTVAQAIEDPRLLAFVKTLLLEDVQPTLPAAVGGPAFVASLFERFRNPAIVHRLSQIAWDGSQKLPVRLLGTVRDALAIAAPLDRLCVPLAAWLHFLRQAQRQGDELVDPLADTLLATAAGCDGDPARDVARWLGLRSVFGDDLPESAGFRAALERAYARVSRWPEQSLT